MNFEMIENLCHVHTLLSDEDIQCIKQMAVSLPGLASGSESGVDFFIDCPCRGSSEAVVVAQESALPSLYDFSTVGYIIQEDAEPAVFRSLRLGIETEEVRAVTMANTSQHFVVQTVRPIHNNGRVIGALIAEKEYRKPEYEASQERPVLDADELALRPYLRNVDWLAGCIHDAVIITDETGIIRYRNETAARIYRDYGYINDILGMEYRKTACHGELPPNYANDTVISIRGSFYRIEQRHLTAEGCAFTVTVMHDVTAERRRTQSENIRKASIQEAHHRIKNSLNIIYSLLDMQRRRCGEEAAESLRTAMNRIISVASVYDVAGEAVPDKVSLFQTLLQIREHFNQMTAQDGRSLNITVQGTDISVDTDVSTVVALVINELLQNAYKYAFPGRKDGNVHIELNNGSLYPLLTVADDGVGFDVSSATGAGMGYRIINMLVQNNLGSQLDVRSGPEGTRVTFGFHLR